MKRDIIINIRVNEEEKKLLQEKAISNNMKLSEFIKKSAMGTSKIEEQFKVK